VYKISPHELQELFFLSHDHGAMDDEELLLLYEEFLPRYPDFLHKVISFFSLTNSCPFDACKKNKATGIQFLIFGRQITSVTALKDDKCRE